MWDSLKSECYDNKIVWIVSKKILYLWFESNRKETKESNQIETTWFKLSQKTLTRETSDANDRGHGGGSDAPMVGLVTWRCARGNHDSGGDALVHRGSHRRSRSRSRSVIVKRVVFHVMGPWSWSQGVLLAPSDWQVRVFRTSGLVDRQSDRLYIRNIPLSGFMNRCSRYIPNFEWIPVIPIIDKHKHILVSNSDDEVESFNSSEENCNST